jgi:hypothetical protein
MRIVSRWSYAYSLTLRFGLPSRRHDGQRPPLQEWHAAAAGRAAWMRHPGAPRIDASLSRRAAAAPLRPRPPGRRPVARSGHPWRALQRAKPARAMDGVRFRAGASLRACFGLREARQDGEPSQVEAIQGERWAFRKPFLSPGDAGETGATGSTRLTSRSPVRPLWKKCHWLHQTSSILLRCRAASPSSQSNGSGRELTRKQRKKSRRLTWKPDGLRSQNGSGLGVRSVDSPVPGE